MWSVVATGFRSRSILQFDAASFSLFVWLVADGWCWFVLTEKYCWLVVGGWFVLREKYLISQANKAFDYHLGLGLVSSRLISISHSFTLALPA
jgi:hypothetical protein